jgi:hypothetical protein
MDILINIGMIVMYLLLAVGMLALLFFSVKVTISNIGNSKVTIITIIAFAVLFIVSYLLSDSKDVSVALFEKTATDPGLSKMIGTGLIIFYFMLIAAVGSTIYAAISKMLK